MSLPCSSLNLRQLQPFGVALGEQGAQLEGGCSNFETTRRKMSQAEPVDERERND
jgi:hypothetical protein